MMKRISIVLMFLLFFTGTSSDQIKDSVQTSNNVKVSDNADIKEVKDSPSLSPSSWGS